MRPSGILVGFLSIAQSLTQIGAEKVLSNSETTVSNDSSLLWGPYRPSLYFGVRPRIPKSLLAGLIWGNVDDYARAQNNFRHTCEQHEGMAGYGWESYDARKGGREVIHDAGNKIDITIDFVKFPGGPKGGSWGARIKGSRRDDAPANLVTTVVFYAGMEGLGELGFTNKDEEYGHTGTVTIHGSTSELGEFDIDVVDGPDNTLPYKIHPSWDEKPLDKTLTLSLQAPPDQVWRAKDILFGSFKQTLDRYVKQYGQENMPAPWQGFTIDNKIQPGNFHLIQKVFVSDFQFDIIYKSGSGVEAVSSETLDEAIASASKDFKSKFNRVFDNKAPFKGGDYSRCSQSLFSNLLGGVGYFYGDSMVDRSLASEYDEENEGFWEETAEARARNQISQDPPTELFTSVPSRPFFPRGFLWDEGFHLIPIVEWDLELTLEIVDSWFKLMDSDGWIAREQILGPEARSKVPQEFTVQYPHYANPPTLFLIIDTLVEKLQSGQLSAADAHKVRSTLLDLHPLLTRHYNWFRKTQFGDIKSYDREAFSMKEGYRWRGRTPQHILTSGLDDYPRAQPPHPGELHLDLISWVGLMARSLSRLATLLSSIPSSTDFSDDITKFTKQHEAIQHNIDDLHWSEKEKMYCDATIDDYEEHTLVCHKGYISLFPFMTQVLPAGHKSIPHILNLLSDPEHLWSPYGIRSLSKSSSFYGTDENYWRSPIWVNMNYLILKALYNVAGADGKAADKQTKEQARKLYVDLRKNLVNNVVDQWKETGFAWEQYNPDTGRGQRTQHFTGWTSLVVVMMNMPDLSQGVQHGEL